MTAMFAAARRETISIHSELRALAWLGVMLIATGVGIVIKNHIDEIGPLTIAFAVGLFAAACYTYVAVKKKGALDDYVVLLGALLISADAGFIERQWHLLGDAWQWHLLLLAILHGVAAYYFGARGVLSLSVTALAAFIGAQTEPQGTVAWAERAFIAAGAIGVWRLVNRRAEFNPVFEHFAANLAFWGSLTLTVEPKTRWLGFLIAMALATGAVWVGLKRSRVLFVIYGYIYGLIAINIMFGVLVQEPVLISMFVMSSTVAAIVAIVLTNTRMRHAASDADA